MQLLAQRLAVWDKALIEGRGHEVAEELRTLNVPKIPHNLRVEVARAARRSGSYALGLKVLHSVIYSDRHNDRPSPAAIAEYGALLSYLGAPREAIRLMEQVDPSVIPEVLLFRSFAHFNRWEYGKTVPLLQRYVQLCTTEYSRLVGLLNLAAALTSEQNLELATQALDEIEQIARSRNYKRMLANCAELRAQGCILATDWRGGRRHLEFAREILAADRAMDSFFVVKWTSILRALESHDIRPLTELRVEAKARRDWETLRELELFQLKVQMNADALGQLYFGTPLAAYRERITKHLGVSITQSQFKSGSGQIQLDLSSGHVTGPDLDLRAPPLVRMVLQSLGRDFFRSYRATSLFEDIFPGEYFNIHSSLNRVHQAIFRTRTWLNQHGIPAQILEECGEFRLERSDEISVVVPRDLLVLNDHEKRLLLLRQKFGQEFFQPQEARQALNLTPASFKKFVRAAVSQDAIARSGCGPAVFYRCLIHFPLPMSQNKTIGAKT